MILRFPSSAKLLINILEETSLVLIVSLTACLKTNTRNVVLEESLGTCMELVLGYHKATYGYTPTYMELLVLKIGLQIACDNNFYSLEIETDATEVLQLLCYDNYSLYTNFVNECGSLLRNWGSNTNSVERIKLHIFWLQKDLSKPASTL